MRVLKTFAIISTCLLVLLFVPYIICIYSEEYNDAAALLSTFIGIVSTIGFGLWVSYAFQYVNDQIYKRKINDIRIDIRAREFAALENALNDLARIINMKEDMLFSVFPYLKSSFTKTAIDIENLEKNLFVFWYAYENIEELGFIDKRIVIEANTEALLMLHKKRTSGIEGAVEPKLHRYFSKVNEVCIHLKRKMVEYNENFKYDIFSCEEIKLITWFCFSLVPYQLSKHRLRKMLEYLSKVNDLASFLTLDFIPFYQLPDFPEIIEKNHKDDELEDEEYKLWEAEGLKSAEALIKSMSIKS